MIKHIVCFKLTDNSEESKQAARKVLLSMRGQVPTVKEIEVGLDVLGSARSYDVILQVVVDDLNALEQYQHDQYHCDIVKTYMHAHTEKSIAIDYEI